MAEQGTHKPLVVGSNPTLAIICLRDTSALAPLASSCSER